MPNMKNAEKAVRVIAKRKEINNNITAKVKTAIKKVKKSVINNAGEEAKDNLKVAIKELDKAKSKGVVNKNFVARQKSRLSKKVNELK